MNEPEKIKNELEKLLNLTTEEKKFNSLLGVYYFFDICRNCGTIKLLEV